MLALCHVCLFDWLPGLLCAGQSLAALLLQGASPFCGSGRTQILAAPPAVLLTLAWL